MPGQVEGNDAEALENLAVVEERPVLAAVGARGVQAQKRNALPGFLDIEPVRLAADGEAQVAADDRLEMGFAVAAHRATPDLVRGSASRSLK